MEVKAIPDLKYNYIISFVVQNYTHNTPFLIKTLRYAVLVKSFNTLLFSTFIKTVINYSKHNQYAFFILPWVKFFFKKQFVDSFYRFFKKIFFKKYGIYTSNMLKSSLYWTIRNISSELFVEKDTLFSERKPLNLISLDIIYYKPVKLVSLAFHKKTYNSLMLYILFFLVNTYISTLPTFQLNYSFLLLPSNFQLYMFVNCFYFKIKNY